MTTPAYYQFPGGLQPLHLSRHLTSNAGQAVQYLARSSRLDGVSKGQDEDDLNKALDFIRDEIDRRFGALPADGAVYATPDGTMSQLQYRTFTTSDDDATDHEKHLAHIITTAEANHLEYVTVSVNHLTGYHTTIATLRERARQLTTELRAERDFTADLRDTVDRPQHDNNRAPLLPTELDALPIGSIVLYDGEPWQRIADDDRRPHGTWEGLQEFSISAELTGATILYVPDPTD